MSQSLLMTGATGLVGSRFVEMYSDQYEIHNMDLTTGVDITDKFSIEKFITTHPANTMIHLAAFTNMAVAFDQTDDKSGLCYQVNVDGTRNIAEVCKKHGIHLIHISTDFVFDGKLDRPYTEDDSTSSVEWYGKTKAIAEKIVTESETGYTIVRISYPYRKDFPDKPDLVKKIRSGLESGKLYPQFTDSTITPTFIDDIARGFDKAVQTKPQGIYHFTGSTSLSPYELARKVAITYDFDPELVKKGNLTEYLKLVTRPFARHVAVSNAKAIQDLGLTFMTIDEGLSAITS